MNQFFLCVRKWLLMVQHLLKIIKYSSFLLLLIDKFSASSYLSQYISVIITNARLCASTVIPSLTQHKDSMSQCLRTHQSRTFHLRDASSKGRIVQGTHRPRDAPSKGHTVQGTHRPRDALPIGRNIRDFSFGDALVRNETTMQRIFYSVSGKH